MSLGAFFNPRSVAVLGASASPDKLGYTLLKNVVDGGFAGAIYPVNRRGGRILDLPVAATVADLAGRVDLALISIPGAEVPAAVRACAAAGVRAAVILASGFGETGADGQAIQAEMRQVARAAGMRLIGPNCMGVYNPAAGLNGSYFWALPEQTGGVSFISQSGAMGGLFFADAGRRGLGVAKFASVGNTADVEHADLLEYLGDDPQTDVIGLFVEGIRDGARFMAVARRVAAAKPVVILKGGRSGAGARASASHTGSLAGEERVYAAVMQACGVLWTQSSDEFFDSLAALAHHHHRLPKNDAMAVITISGGPSVLAADHGEERGIAVPPLSPQTQAALRELMPAFATAANPVDLTPQIFPPHIPAAIDAILADPAIGGGLFINLGLDHAEFAQALATAPARHGKPLVALVSAAPQIQAALVAAGIPNYPAPERAVAGYHALIRRRALQRQAAAPLPEPPAPGQEELPAHPDEHDAKIALARYGLPVTREARVSSRGEALDVAALVGYPVALKVCRPDLLHKTEAGGVHLHLKDAAALYQAYSELSERFGDGPYLVQKMLQGSVELLLGGRRDPVFGPVLAFGIGGIYVEVLSAPVLVPAPLTLAAAVAAVQRSQAAPLLRGLRGGPVVEPVDVARCLVALGDFMAAYPSVSEVDVNPLLLTPAGPVAADAVIVLDGGMLR